MTTTGPNPSDDRPTTDDTTRATADGPEDLSTRSGAPDVEQTTTEASGGAAGHGPESHGVDRTTDSEPRKVRVGTVVWGLVVALVGVGVLALASGYVFDIELAFIGLVTLAGVALLVGSLINGARRRER